MEPLPLSLLPHQPTPPGLICYGFDVSWPVSSYHSGIYQPSFLRFEPSWVEKLNQYGLLPNAEEARQFRDSFVEYKNDGLGYEVICISGSTIL